VALRILRTPAAEQDLVDIWRYIAEDNEQAAGRVLDRFDQLLRMLADNPLAGRARPELGDDIRSLPSGNYVLFYRVESELLILVRALSGYMDFGIEDFE